MHKLPRPAAIKDHPADAAWLLAWACVIGFAGAMYATMQNRVLPDHFLLPPIGRNVPWTLTSDDRLALSAASATPIALFRHKPVWLLAALLSEMLGGSILGIRPSALMMAVVVAVFVVCLARSRPVGLAAAVSALGLWTAQDWLVQGRILTGSRTATAALALTVAFLGGVFLRERRQHASAIRTQTTAQAVIAERLRIARELHDMVAHSIGIVAIQAGAAKRVIDTQPDRAREALDAIETTSRETLAGLRQVLGALRRAETDQEDRAPTPGLADLEQLTAAAAGAGVRVEVQWLGEPRRLPPEIDLSAFRIIQESVTNVVRHAATQRCRVGLQFGPDELVIEVVDDGRAVPGSRPAGLEGDADGYGLTGMRERVKLLRGQFSAGPRPEGGFRVEARIPA